MPSRASSAESDGAQWMAARLGEDERERLRPQLDAGGDHVALALARGIPDDGAAAALDLRDDLLDAEPAG